MCRVRVRMCGGKLVVCLGKNALVRWNRTYMVRFGLQCGGQECCCPVGLGLQANRRRRRSRFYET